MVSCWFVGKPHGLEVSCLQAAVQLLYKYTWQLEILGFVLELFEGLLV